MGELWDILQLTLLVFVGSLQVLGYIGLFLFVYIAAIALHEQYVRRRIRRETKQELESVQAN